MTSEKEQEMSHVPYGSLEDERECVSIDEAVEQSGYGWFQLRLLLICALLLASDAMEVLLLSVLGPELRCDWHLQNYQVALITTLVFVGMFVGSTVNGLASDILGRRPILIIIAWWISYFGVLTSFSPTINWMYCLRFLVGFALAGSFLCVPVQMEYLPKSKRARGAAVSLFAWPVGVVVQSVLAILIVPNYGWRTLVVASAVPMIVCAVLFSICLPESPRYLLVTDQIESATCWVQKMAKTNGLDFRGTIASTKHTEQSGSIRESIRDLLHPTYRVTSLVLVWLWFASGILYYGNIILSAEMTGFQNACWKRHHQVANVSEVFECELKCRGLTHADYKIILITSLGELFGPSSVYLLADTRLGRRRSLTLFASLAGLGFFFIQFCYPYAVLTIISLFARAMCSATFTLTMIYTTELYPTTVRGLSFGIGNSMARVGAMLTPFIAQVLSAVSFTATIYVYVIVAALTALLSLLLPIETRGRAMKQTVHEPEDT